MSTPSNKQAFILRISPDGLDLVPEAIKRNEIIIGWGVYGLLESNLKRSKFRSIISDHFYPQAQSLRQAGAASGHMWRFINEMNNGDLVVVPYNSKFFVAEVTGDALFSIEHPKAGSTYRRPVRWLNGEKPIPRNIAKSPLVSRMKTQGTSAGASDLLAEIEDCIETAEAGRKPTFQEDLEIRLVRETLDELRKGRIDSFGFEHLISSVLLNAGAIEAKVVARSKDKGADVLATFLVAGTFQQVVAVQAKHWQAEPPVDQDVIDQLIAGIEFEQANLGMIITSGTISDAASEAADAYFDEKGIKIELVDGEQFAKMIVEHGVGES
jgi:predicted Mrr-cat superfamily restriction endonuclease